jgi:hypothetical protein
MATGMIFVLLAFVGLAFDVGFVQWQRRRAQTAADAAAVAGAWAKQQGGSATTDGKAGSAMNGFADGSSGVTVTINNPPTGGSYTTDSSAVEAIVSQDAPSYFMRVLGFNILPVRARAVARQGYGTACIYALNKTASDTLKISGSVNVNLGCGGIAESTSTSALDIVGGPTITMSNGASLAATGGYKLDNNATITPANSVSGDDPSPGDPLSTLPMPAPDPTLPHYDATAVATNGGTLQPGVYCGGIHLNSGVNVSFDAGLYILASGGLQINSATVTANGVTFYTTDDKSDAWNCPGLTGNKDAGPIQINSTANVTLTAPTSGAYAGIAMFQNRADTYNQTNTINGSSTSVFDGALYFPTTALNFSGAANPTGYMVIVADTVAITGTAGLSLNNFPTAFADNNPAFKQWISVAE